MSGRVDLGRTAAGRAVARVSRVGDRRPPAPRVTVTTGPAVRAIALRLAVAVVAAATVAATGPGLAEGLLAGVVAVSFVMRPHPVAPALFALLVGWVVVAAGADVATWQVALPVLGVHLVVEVATLVDDLPPWARVEVAVLRGAAAPFAAVQLGAQALLALARWWSGVAPEAAWLPVVAGAAVAGLVWTTAALVRRG